MRRQIAADLLGLPVGQVRFEYGDTALPFAVVAGGSSQTISVAVAVQAACEALKRELLKLMPDGSPLKGLAAEAVAFRDGGLGKADDPKAGESFAAILNRAGKPALDATADVKPGDAAKQMSMQSYGAQFCEVRVDPAFGTVR